MIAASCANCWHNALQHDAIGLTVGYCALHKKILSRSAETACGQQRRRDLPLASADRENQRHRAVFDEDVIVVLATGEPANGELSTTESDFDRLREDLVGEAVTDYGQLGAKIESLAQLKNIPGGRAEVAMLSLGRAYVANCVAREGLWTSGIHLLWWTKKRIADAPVVEVRDLWNGTDLPLAERIDLAKWSLVMLRLIFVADIASYADRTGHALGELRSLPEEAAEGVDDFDVGRLLRWIKRHAAKQLETYFPQAEYTELSLALHRPRESLAS